MWIIRASSSGVRSDFAISSQVPLNRSTPSCLWSISTGYPVPRDLFREPDVFLDVAKRRVERAGAVVGRAGLEREEIQATVRAPGLGGGHESAADAAPLHANRGDELAYVGVSLASEVEALGGVHDADDLVTLDGYVYNVVRPPGRVGGVRDPAAHRCQPGGAVPPRRLAV